MDTFEIIEGSLGPSLDAVLTNSDQTPQDLTGGGVKFYMEKRSTGVIKVNGVSATVLNAPLGMVRYVWQSGDTDTPGVYRAQWQVEGLNPTPVRFPTQSPGWFQVIIHPRVS